MKPGNRLHRQGAKSCRFYLADESKSNSLFQRVFILFKVNKGNKEFYLDFRGECYKFV